MNPNAIFVIVGGPKHGQWIGPLTSPIKAKILQPFVSQEFAFFLAELNQEDLTFLADLMQEGKVIPVIGRRYPLSEVPEAIRHVEEGHARGKVVITVEHDDQRPDTPPDQ